MHLYNLSITKARIIEAVSDLVTEDIQWCSINCTVTYNQTRDWYRVYVSTIDRHPRYIKMSEEKITSAIKNVFNRNSRSMVFIYYNHRCIGNFSDI